MPAPPSDQPTIGGVSFDTIRQDQVSFQNPSGPLALGWSVSPMRMMIGMILIFGVIVCVYLPVRGALS